ncbi:beta-L-arabinofuranosidase domain-containing protein [Butyrivibrio sp. YAB3001]|uniref:beta-L-arabinofuranosidase domain-containing protein n=1 Tax=Butyrivibrio sp. YAB3001 TaxID=1520812 RepID=UPI0008F61769|nr:beta-L-arabinofuranosidase domain-containing protein [Butyrivibrio sp. YAB3001]SFC43140.1 hypothetical protein SAMN02910398_02251 [Butyrivibrio sp. YAB3001]
MESLWKSVPHGNVKVTDVYYDEALKIDVKNMLLLDVDRLLAGFREAAGFIAGLDADAREKLMKGKKRYGGMWEDGMIGGHTLGHYITAMAQAMANPGLSQEMQAEVAKKLEYVIDALKECQDYTVGTEYEGFIFGANLPTKEFQENPALQFDNVEKGLGEIFTQAWVPWYTMHKILTGLNAAFRVAGNEKALQVANSLGKWISNRTKKWDKETHRTVLGIEYGGMNDCLYELYQINKDLNEKNSNLCDSSYEEFKEAAHCFDDETLFEKIFSGKENVLNNTHANTTIPKFIGALARYEVDHNEAKYLEYAKAFWDMVVLHHTYVTGGNSEDEHFGEDDVLDKERTNVNNETCNTYNMLKFSKRLFEATGEKKYLEYVERTLINAIMASQNHETGFTTYFQPMATGYHKVFNTLDGNFWCCTGTGYENFTKLQRGIYYQGKEKMLIALYLASECKMGDYSIKQDCDLSKSDEIRITITPNEGRTVNDDIWLRKPEWICGKPDVKIEGTNEKAEEKEGFFVIPNDFLTKETTIVVRFPMSISCTNLQDGMDTYAFSYGPFVLSARLGTAKISTTSHGVAVSVSASRSVESDHLKVTAEKSVDEYIKNIDKYLIKREGQMEFDLTGVSKDLVFTTHYNQYKESYGIYWAFEC